MLPKGKIAEIRIEGKDVSEILESAYLLITEVVKKTDHKIDMERFYWCEIYTLERYAKKLEKGDKIQIDYIVPVIE